MIWCTQLDTPPLTKGYVPSNSNMTSHSVAVGKTTSSAMFSYQSGHIFQDQHLLDLTVR